MTQRWRMPYHAGGHTSATARRGHTAGPGRVYAESVHGHAAAAAAAAAVTPGLPPARLDDSLREALALTLLLNAD